MLDVGNSSYKYQSSHIYSAYIAFCKDHLMEVKSMEDFSEELKELGLDKRKSHGCMYWFGIKPIAKEGELTSLLFPS